MNNNKPNLSQNMGCFFAVLESGTMTEPQYRAFRKSLTKQVEAATRLASDIPHTDERMADARKVLGIETISHPTKLKLVKG